MENLASAIEKWTGFCNSIFPFNDSRARCNPIEILKRLQREAFSDLMKLRERQDKVEKIVSFYRTSRGSPFEESSTIVRGEVDVLGAALMMDSADQQSCDAVSRAGIRTGIHSKFTFERSVRQKDILMAELVARRNSDVSGSALSLAKVLYVANVTDWFSAIAVPVGAQCRDVSIATNSLRQEKGQTEFSSSGPPFLHQHIGRAIGLTVRKLNATASLAQCVSEQCFSTFGQIVCKLTQGTKVSLYGRHQLLKPSGEHASLGALTLPVSFSKHGRAFVEGSGPVRETAGCIAVMVESGVDESTRLRAWMEKNQSELRWAVSVSDDCEDGSGWGMSVSGMKETSTSRDHRLQFESYVRVGVGNGFTLQPGFVYVMDGTARIPGLMLRSTWNI